MRVVPSNTILSKIGVSITPLYIALILTLLLLSGCSLFGDSGNNTTGPTNDHLVKQDINPCSLVTNDEAGTILGAKVASQTAPGGASVPSSKTTACQYISASSDPTKLVEASVSLVINQDVLTTQGAFQQLKDSSKTNTRTYQDVAGVGNGAFSNEHILTVQKDNVILIISAVVAPTSPGNEANATLDAEKQLAQKAISRL